MNKNIDDVLRDHISIYDELIKDKKKYIEQVDYLAFYVDQKAREQCNPFEEYKYADRDNTNRMHTKHENVYAMIDEKQRIFLTYSEWWNAPITILRRAKYKERRRIDIYWKALKLYYSWKLTRLEDYVKKYQWETQRVDICRDMKNKPSEYICDLGYNKKWEKTWKKVIVETNNERTYRTYWAKDSRLFIRIYDKTLDLKEDKFIHAYLYPERYKNECRRLEAKLTLEYARADTPYNRLKMLKRDKTIERKENKERLMYKTILLYTIWIAEQNVPNIEDCIYVLNQARMRINNKINLLNNKLPKWKE